MTSRVVIRHREKGNGWHLFIDGVDMAQEVLAESVAVTFTADGLAHLSMSLLAVELDLDMPEVEVVTS